MWVEKNGPTFRIRDLVHGSKVTVQSGFPTKTAAKKVMTVLEGEQIQGTYVDPRGGRMLLSEFAAIWWPTHAVSLQPTSVKSEGGRLRNHILPLLGDYKLAEMDRMVVTGWVAELLAGDEDEEREPLAEKTIRNVHGVLYSLMQAAVDGHLIRSNPCYRTGLPKVPHKEMRFLDEAETARLVTATPAYWRPLVVTLLATGIRWSEVAGLRVKVVDVLGRTLRVEETLHEISPGQPLVEGPTKTPQSRRTVTYPPSVAGVLVPLVSMRDRDARVFLGEDGEPLRYGRWWRLWVKITAAAGLVGLRTHDLRHTHAAHLISDGVPLTGVQRRLGHSSITVTSDMYGHLLPVVDEKIDAAVENLLSKVDFAAIVGESVGETGSEQPGTTGKDEEERAA
jgi:integrase